MGSKSLQYSDSQRLLTFSVPLCLQKKKDWGGNNSACFIKLMWWLNNSCKALSSSWAVNAWWILVIFIQNPKVEKSTLLPDHKYVSHLWFIFTIHQGKSLVHCDPLLTWGCCPVPYIPGVPKTSEEIDAVSRFPYQRCILLPTPCTSPCGSNIKIFSPSVPEGFGLSLHLCFLK